MPPPSDPPEIAAAIEQALALHRQGALNQAKPIYLHVLEIQPQHARVMYLLGVAAMQEQQPQQAVTWIGRAIALQPAVAAYHVGLGQALAELGNPHEAIAAFTQAIALQDDFEEAWFALGVALQNVGKYAPSETAYRRVIALNAARVEAHSNLGNVLHLTGQSSAAIAAFQQALQLDPLRPATHHNLGVILHSLKQWPEAEAALRRAIELQPKYASAHANLGCVLLDQKRLAEATAALHRALDLSPRFAPAWYNLGNALNAQGQFDSAVAAYRQAIQIQNPYPAAQINLGNVLQKLGQFQAAADCYLESLKTRPDDPDALCNLAAVLRTLGRTDAAIATLKKALEVRPDFHIAHCNLGNVLKDIGRIDQAIAAYRHAIELRPNDAVTHSNLVYTLSYDPDANAAAILHEARQFDAIHARHLTQSAPPHDNTPDPARRLRIGYVAADFRDHCQSLFTVPLLEHHDHKDFEIFCYANVPCPDDYTRRLMRSADVWRSTCGQTNEEIARLIRADRIDILVDLTMHMSNGRPLLFARKPAPLQVAYLAYPGTTGLSAIDYRLSDPYLDPPENDAALSALYSEKTLRLPETFWCYDPLDSLSPVPRGERRGEGPMSPLPAIANGYITFGCLNNFCKVQDPAIRLWSRVLAQVGSSRLLLLCPQGKHRAALLGQFSRHSISADRLEFVPYRPRSEYLRTYHRIDLGLDTFPYNGHTTSLDAMWMGVPVITRVGTTVVGRAGLSQLSNLGLTDLVAQSDDDFLRIAVDWANNLSRLAELRRDLRPRMQRSPLMDAPRFARNLQALWRDIWRQWCEHPA